MNAEQLVVILEAALLAAGRALSVDDLLALFEGRRDAPSRDDIRQGLSLLEQHVSERAVELTRVASGYRLQVRAEHSPWLAGLFAERAPRYSRALLETLALIAYRQPITRGEIEEVRGVAVSSNIVRTLLEREWIRTLGHREVPGRPTLYGTTRDFLDHFGLKSLDGLPALAELRDLDRVEQDLFAALPGRSEAPAQGDGSSETVHTLTPVDDSSDGSLDAAATADEPAASSFDLGSDEAGSDAVTESDSPKDLS